MTSDIPRQRARSSSRHRLEDGAHAGFHLVDDLELLERFLFCFRQIFVGCISAGELGLAASG